MTYLFERLHALTGSWRKLVVAFFSAISLIQFLIGMYLVGIGATKPGTWGLAWLLQAIMPSP